MPRPFVYSILAYASAAFFILAFISQTSPGHISNNTSHRALWFLLMPNADKWIPSSLIHNIVYII